MKKKARRLYRQEARKLAAKYAGTPTPYSVTEGLPAGVLTLEVDPPHVHIGFGGSDYPDMTDDDTDKLLILVDEFAKQFYPGGTPQ